MALFKALWCQALPKISKFWMAGKAWCHGLGIGLCPGWDSMWSQNLTSRPWCHGSRRFHSFSLKEWNLRDPWGHRLKFGLQVLDGRLFCILRALCISAHLSFSSFSSLNTLNHLETIWIISNCYYLPNSHFTAHSVCSSLCDISLNFSKLTANSPTFSHCHFHFLSLSSHSNVQYS